MATIKAIITTLDNLPLLKEQVQVLRADPLISEIIVVSNGSKDGTNEWLATQAVTSIVRENKGAGPGRNAGLDAAGKFDYILMLDGGIRPLIGGTQKMLDYLEQHPATADRFERVDVLGVEIPHFETDPEKAWRRWPAHLDIKSPAQTPPSTDECQAYHNWSLSQTAYCLARWEAFYDLRFCEEGPFGEPGWGADDDEMMCQWREAGIIIHAVCNVHPYRRASGSFHRLFKETGIWPNQYGSVYEKRVVWLQQNWPQYSQGVQWGEPWLTVVIKVNGMAEVELIKQAHDLLRERRFTPPWDKFFNPYSVIAWCPEAAEDFLHWAEHTCLRQHQGNAIMVDGNILRRNEQNEKVWTGDFHIWREVDWHGAIRPDAHYYTFVKDTMELEKAIDKYNKVFPPASSSEERPEVVGVEL